MALARTAASAVGVGFRKLRTFLRLVRLLADTDIRRNANRLIHAYRKAPEFTCPCCGHRGRFDLFGDTGRLNQECPGCQSKPRQRLVMLALKAGFLSFGGRDVLHFAPERALRPIVLAQRPRRYQTADLAAGRADLVLDIEAAALPDGYCDLIICSHVLEHVDDRKALAEMHRLLRPGGEAILLVPIVEGWSQTYENQEAVTEEARHRHFAQFDHVRIFGADFRERVRGAGFTVTEFTAEGRACAEYGLERGEKIFKARRS